MPIVAHKVLQGKSKRHRAESLGPWTFEVTSGDSRESYIVTLTPYIRQGAVRYVTGTCTCDYGTAGRHSTPDGKVYWQDGQRPISGCSHVQAAVAAKFGRRMSGWGSKEDAQRQHRPIYDVGDNVWLTGRLTAQETLERGRAILHGDLDLAEL